jgi:arsenate reductase-like glutaredoxin family protein
MNIMIYGTKKCGETRKAERFFQERRIKVQFRDISDKPLTEGELRNLASGHRVGELVDATSRSYERRGLAHMEYDAAEELLADASLLVTPIIRVDGRSLVRPTAKDLAALLNA